MKFYIPTIGTKFELSKPWEFLLYKEYRNSGPFEAFGKHAEDLVQVPIKEKDYNGYYKSTAYKFSLPPKTVMKVDRIYIKKTSRDFDSVTLKIFETTHPFILHKLRNKNGSIAANKARFWVKLCDFNKIEANVLEDNVLSHKLTK